MCQTRCRNTHRSFIHVVTKDRQHAMLLTRFIDDEQGRVIVFMLRAETITFFIYRIHCTIFSPSNPHTRCSFSSIHTVEATVTFTTATTLASIENYVALGGLKTIICANPYAHTYIEKSDSHKKDILVFEALFTKTPYCTHSR